MILFNTPPLEITKLLDGAFFKNNLGTIWSPFLWCINHYLIWQRNNRRVFFLFLIGLPWWSWMWKCGQAEHKPSLKYSQWPFPRDQEQGTLYKAHWVHLPLCQGAGYIVCCHSWLSGLRIYMSPYVFTYPVWPCNDILKDSLVSPEPPGHLGLNSSLSKSTHVQVLSIKWCHIPIHINPIHIFPYTWNLSKLRAVPITVQYPTLLNPMWY